MTNPISLKLAWADGSAEIACEAGQFETAVAAAERLLGIAVSRAAPPTGGPRASAAAPSAGESSVDDDSVTHREGTGQMLIDADAADTLFAKIGARRAGR